MSRDLLEPSFLAWVAARPNPKANGNNKKILIEAAITSLQNC